MAARPASTATRQRRLIAAREKFVRTIVESAQAQIDDITKRIEAGSRDGAEAERDARATAALVKVLCALGDGNEPNGGNRKQDEAAADDDNGPRDLDEFRRELGRQMDDIITRRTHRAAGEADEARG